MLLPEDSIIYIGGGCSWHVALYIKAEMHDISVLNYIFFSFYAHFSGFAYGCLRTIFYIVFVFDYFGTDKSFFEVSVDYSCLLYTSDAADEYITV